MPRFKRLTYDEAQQLTRGDLLERLTAESEYWRRKAEQGRMSAADWDAHREFSRIMRLIDPHAAAVDALRAVRGEPGASYWDSRPQDDAGPEHSEWTGERVVATLARTGDVVRDQRMADGRDCVITRTGTADDGRRVIEWQKVSDRTVTFRLLCDPDSLFALVHRAENAPIHDGGTAS